jgi:hypothetical protein
MALPSNVRDRQHQSFEEHASGEVSRKVSEQKLIGGETPNGLRVVPNGLLHYVATAAVNEVIADAPGYLHGIIIGEDVASSTIEVSDHASDGDGNVKIFLSGSTLMTANGGYVPVNAVFSQGITADIVNQTKITFVYSLIS